MPAAVQRSLIQLQLMWVRSLDCGLAGKGVAEKIDPTVEDAYWRENYTTRPYYKKGATYETYQPAYRTGQRPNAVHRQKLRRGGNGSPERLRNRGASSLTWEHAKDATRDAWHRVERAIPGDFDKDGR
jgi:hypothetical protein